MSANDGRPYLATRVTVVVCPICDSSDDVTDCGEVASDLHHYECSGCCCGFDRVPEYGSTPEATA